MVASPPSPLEQGALGQQALEQRERAATAQRLWIGCLVLLLLFAAAVLNAALPLRLLDPRWQLALIAALLANGPLPLLALLISHLAVVLHPANLALRRRCDRLARLGLIAALGFLLLIPLQVAATWASIGALARIQSRQQDVATQTISQLRQAISAASSTADLQARLTAQSLPVSGSFDPALPFPQQQRKLLAGLQRSEDQLQARPLRLPIPWGAMLTAALRVLPAAAALAFGFYALGRRRWAVPLDQQPPGSRWLDLGGNPSALDLEHEAYISQLHPDDPG